MFSNLNAEKIMLLRSIQIIFILSFGLIYTSSAQVSTYFFQSDISNYDEIATGTFLGDTTSEDEYFIDPVFPLGGSTQSGPGLPIGFNFLYNGFNYDVFGVNVNGWIALGTGGVNMNSASDYFPLNSSTGGNFLAGFARNLQAQGGSSIIYSTIGTSPNQTLVIQWKNFRKHGNIGDNFNFQILLYEGSNQIEFSYGEMTCNLNASFVTVGMIGNDSSDFNLRGTGTGGWVNSINGATNTATCTLNPSSVPPVGLHYKWEAPAPCTAPPVPGVALSSFSTVCPNNPFIVSLSGNSSGPGQTYQWQSSPDSITWTDLTGATVLSYSSTQVIANWYRCAVTCSGLTAYSTPVFVDFSSPTLCYCTQNLGGDCMGYGSIDSVRIFGTTLANVGTGCGNLTAPNYSDYPPSGFTTATLIRNATYEISVTTTFNANISLWIDYDRNGSFDASEWSQISASTTINVPSSILFIVPPTASLGTTKMRIRTRLSGATNGAIDACTNFLSGETEDYTIVIDDGTGISLQAKSGEMIRNYPNPAESFILLEAMQNLHHPTLKLFDLNGKICYSTNVDFLGNGNSTKIDVNAVPSGMYILECTSSEGVQHSRIQIIH